MTAWNTAGTVAGAFLGGFVLIPRLGLRASLILAAAATAVAGVLALRHPGAARWRRPGWIAAGIALLVALLLPGWPLGMLAQGAGYYAAIYGSAEGLIDVGKALGAPLL